MALTEQLSRPEFEVLKALTRRAELISESDLDLMTGFGPREVDEARESLAASGLIEDNRITAAGIAALEPYRVKNAIVQAAGWCSRFAPISYDIHKGLIRVSGVPLVERLICQLFEAGIFDVTLVVGHKKEMYSYLAAKYGVRLAENPDYVLYNTMTTIYHVRERLGRTYILYSDTYFAENPFERYVWEGFYATAPVEGHTDEWIYVPGPDGYVCDMHQGGDSGERIGGFACLDEAIVSQLVPILEAEYGKPEPMRQFWETMWFRNMDTVRIRTRCLPRNHSFEFDTMDELRAFDPNYIRDVQSPSIDNICRVLNCRREDIHNCFSMGVGLTNRSCHFAVGNREYVYRHPVGFGGRQISRPDETRAEELAKKLGIDRTYLYESPLEGWKISRYRPKSHCLDRLNTEECHAGARLLARFHRTCTLTSVSRFSRWEDIRRYEGLIAGAGAALPEGYAKLRERIDRLHACMKDDGFADVFSHNDAWYQNFLVDAAGSVNLIDWEYAMMADEGSELGFYCATLYAAREVFEELLEIFLGHVPSAAEHRHYAAHAMIAGLWQYAYTIAWKATTEDDPANPVDAWLALQRAYLDDNLSWVEARYR